MTDLVGTWDVTLKTPIGSLPVVYTFTADATQTSGLSGTAASSSETVPLHDIAVEHLADGRRVTWRQSVTKPMRLHLEFDVVVTDATMTGHSRAGRLPRTRVEGRRRD
jgi:hypothetical protein